MSASAVHCELCGTATVQRAGESPPGIEAWRCTACGDFKRWCRECEQGWIRRFQVRATEVELYSCDECEAAWPSVAELRSDGTGRRSLLRRLGVAGAQGRLALVRERTPAPPGI